MRLKSHNLFKIIELLRFGHEYIGKLGERRLSAILHFFLSGTLLIVYFRINIEHKIRWHSLPNPKVSVQVQSDSLRALRYRNIQDLEIPKSFVLYSLKLEYYRMIYPSNLAAQHITLLN